VNIQASPTFQWGSFARIEELIVPKLMAAAAAGAALALAEMQILVPVRTGALRESGQVVPPEWVGHTVTAAVEFGMPYAAYVEFGTGVRGAGSAGAGPFAYDMNWPGMVAQSYMRAGLDNSKPAVLGAFQDALT
jgi:Bacteriophage HK97-gp10, putative tail-component